MRDFEHLQSYIKEAKIRQDFSAVEEAAELITDWLAAINKKQANQKQSPVLNYVQIANLRRTARALKQLRQLL